MIGTRIYALALTCGALAFAACGDDPTGPPLDCLGGMALSIGASENGSLQQGDDLDIDGAFMDRYALEVRDRETVEITLRSGAFDAFLWLLTEDEEVLESNDDGGVGVNETDAQITRTLARGCYFVDATSWEAGETGNYTLTVRRR